MSSLAHPKRSPLRLNRFVFLSSSVSIGILGLLTVLYPEGSEHWLQWAQAEVSAAFGWWYMLLIVLCLGFVLWLAFSPYGRIRLGHNEESPAFGYVAWVSMLFSAGIGIGLLLTIATSLVLPRAVPFRISAVLDLLIVTAFIVISVIGGFISVRVISRIDPVEAIS